VVHVRHHQRRVRYCVSGSPDATPVYPDEHPVALPSFLSGA
jgi:hypothetical protein